MATFNEVKQKFCEKVKEHKTEILVAGGIIVSVAAVILISRKWDLLNSQNITNLLKDGAKAKSNVVPLVPVTIQNTIIDSTSDGRIIEISKHIRNLPEGWKPSLEKLNTALMNGFELAENQTWVDDYPKFCA